MTQLPTFGPLSASITLSPNILWVLFIVVVFVFALVSLALLYHWIRFTLDAKRAALIILVYAAGSGVILLMILSSLSYYHLSIV